MIGLVEKDKVIENRVGVEFKHGLFFAVRRIEETFSPERAVKEFEETVTKNVGRIDTEIAKTEQYLESLRRQRAYAARDVEAWLPSYERAKEMAASNRKQEGGKIEPKQVQA